MSSYYEALPIYRAALDTAVAVDSAAQRFPKGHKYMLNSRLREATADILLGVARANRRADRAQALVGLCDRVEEEAAPAPGNGGEGIRFVRGVRAGRQSGGGPRSAGRSVASIDRLEAAARAGAVAGAVKRRRLAWLLERPAAVAPDPDCTKERSS